MAQVLMAFLLEIDPSGMAGCICTQLLGCVYAYGAYLLRESVELAKHCNTHMQG